MESAVYRIIDANFNRAREATRVIEEFCRFALNSELLTARALDLVISDKTLTPKQIREIAGALKDSAATAIKGEITDPRDI